jgi:hypothetical protein
VDLIVVSPLKRCIQTAFGSLGWLIDAGVPIIADADWQGTSVVVFRIADLYPWLA